MALKVESILSVLSHFTRPDRFSESGQYSKARSQPIKSTQSQHVVMDALKKRIRTDVEFCETDGENSFLVGDLGEVYRQYLQWKRELPRIIPFYGKFKFQIIIDKSAVKCNPDPMVLKLFASLGAGVDCASKAEIQASLRAGISADLIVYANPCKAASHIRFAESCNVRMMTFDNAEELYKIKRLFPTAKLLLRILADDSKSVCRLGLKYGAPLEVTCDLLQLAKELGVDVVGVSFHVGSGLWDASAFIDAIFRARRVFDEAKAIGFDFQLLDVGGGFKHDNFQEIARVLGPEVDKYFPAHVRVIAEPGRFMVATAFTLATNIIARRTVKSIPDEINETDSGDRSFMYYVNDGVYGSFNCILYDHTHPLPRVLYHNNSFDHDPAAPKKVKCSIWGPTCDALDCISDKCYLPYALDVGDWLVWENMGAYTICAASNFNGFKKSDIIYVCSESAAERLLIK
ncbi:Ornithine decarboxylase [Neolecta irregularis DAH-3]|uniref:Ornithine decarboxylase n=1 Tax=Neolecta irregularis (strain DAH-3) TaxID=1198029 RepID=A0A1U7LRI4_NEOID|nr:Ornithine decarboxylase [Neolecta irregularis DAH-3]|eukprot:OLL25239.1 Ornithine decarboxylase [Neolecta irregularis DAH-3]